MEFLMIILFFLCPLIMFVLFLFSLLKISSLCSKVEEMKMDILDKKGDEK